MPTTAMFTVPVSDLSSTDRHATTGNGSQRSLNVKGAYLDVWSDVLGSVSALVRRL
jgi:Co/Zn/Cd efflux system component